MLDKLLWYEERDNTEIETYICFFVFIAQKISPDTKDKIQLQVVFTAGGANTFHFNNSAGRAQQIADRDAVKELLQQMLPRFKPKINNELAEKNRSWWSLS